MKKRLSEIIQSYNYWQVLIISFYINIILKRLQDAKVFFLFANDVLKSYLRDLKYKMRL